MGVALWALLGVPLGLALLGLLILLVDEVRDRVG